jgi:hypothetical protein
MILGRAAAGDWVSLAQTTVDFQAAWPVILLAGVAITVERVIAMTPFEERANGSLVNAAICAVLYVSAGLTYIVLAPMFGASVID